MWASQSQIFTRVLCTDRSNPALQTAPAKNAGAAELEVVMWITHRGRSAETVFYSWQSDLPNKTNRSLIESALTRALQSIVDDVHLQAAPRLDQDTRGVPGSPDIASTILSKIDAASAFVGDVSLVTESEADRPSPSPNVLIEAPICAEGPRSFPRGDSLQ